MPIRPLSLLLLSASLPPLPTPLRPPQAPAGVTVTVIITGAAAGTGTLGAALFAAPAGFPDKTPQAAAALLRPRSSAAADTLVFRNVAPGRYAVAVQHDLNGNGELDKSFVGIPKEPWGVSRDVRPRMRAPRFEEAALDVRADARIDVRVAR